MITEFLKKLFGDDPEKESTIKELAQEIEAQIKSGKIEIPDQTELGSGQKESGDADVQKILQAFTAMQSENKKLHDTLADVLKKENDREETMKNEALKKRADEIKKVMEDANEEGRIPPKNEEMNKKYKVLLEKDFENAKSIIESLPKTAGKDTDKDNGDKDSDDKNNAPAPLTERSKLIAAAKDVFSINEN
jgi:hypothetical protein